MVALFPETLLPRETKILRKVREMIELSLGRLRDVEKERLIAHLGEMGVSCAFWGIACRHR